MERSNDSTAEDLSDAVAPRFRRPGDVEVAEAAREEERKERNLARIEANNQRPSPGVDALGNRAELPSEIRRLTPAEVERRNRGTSNATDGIRRTFEPRDPSRLVDEGRPADMPVNAMAEMTMEDAMRLEREGKLPLRNGRPAAVLTDQGWYTPTSLVPKPPPGALVSDEVARIKGK